MMTDPINTDQYYVALFRRAVLQRDKQARKAVQQRFTEAVRGWLHRHPKREMVCGPGREEQYVAQVFARCWQVAGDRRVDVQTLADVLRYLRVHVTGFQPTTEENVPRLQKPVVIESSKAT